MDKKVKIGNVNLLDMRNAKPEAVAQYQAIGNVNVAITTPQTTPLLSQLQIGNLNISIEVPEKAKTTLNMGQLVITKDFFANLNEPQFLIVMGQLIIKPDVNPADLQKGLAGATVMGQVCVPENLAGILALVAPRVMGQTDTYPAYDQVFIDTLNLDASTLENLQDASEIVVLGKLQIHEVVSNELIARKIKKLYVSGKTTCHAENLEAVKKVLSGKPGRYKVIPEGYHFFDRPLVIDIDFLDMLPVNKIYTTGQVIIDANLPQATFQQSVKGLVSEDLTLCPASLKHDLAQITDILKSQVIFFTGDLWVVDNDDELNASRFDYLASQTTLYVTGHLSVAGSITPDMLAAKIIKVHNLGLISANPAQIAILQSRLGKHDGHFEDCTLPPKETEPSDSAGIGNANILTI